MQIDLAPGATSPSEQSLSKIVQVPAAIMKAWGDHDPDAFAQVFTENGSMVLPGVEVQGRAQISAFMKAAFEGPYHGTQVEGSPVRITVLGPTSMLMFTEGGVRSKDADAVPEAVRVRASWLLVEANDEWQLAAYQNTPKNSAAE